MNLLVFGYGYTARHFVAAYRSAFDTVAVTSRSLDKPFGDADVEPLLFGPESEDTSFDARIDAADAILVSVPPGTSVDPVLNRFGRRIARDGRPQTIVYLSTVGVYGDHAGAWVDEETPPRPASERSKVRVQAERLWLSFARGPSGKRVFVLRLAGIYGPGRNALCNLQAGTARRLIKPDQVFNRIHVADIAGAIAAAFAHVGPSDIWNVTDDEPAPPQDVVGFAAELMDVDPPAEQPFETADLSPMARSFYGENKRVANRRLKDECGVTLLYPTYREGLAALWAEGEGR
jgi:dTDP-4-dehydrorhamnose reductase